MSLSKQSLVLVDDDAAVAALVRAALEGAGFDVETFTDPDEAIDHLRTACPDILIVDMRMPLMNGDEVLQALAHEGRLEGVRLFVTSEVHPPRSMWRAYEAFGTEFVAKDDLVDRARIVPLFKA